MPNKEQEFGIINEIAEVYGNFTVLKESEQEQVRQQQEKDKEE